VYRLRMVQRGGRIRAERWVRSINSSPWPDRQRRPRVIVVGACAVRRLLEEERERFVAPIGVPVLSRSRRSAPARAECEAHDGPARRIAGLSARGRKIETLACACGRTTRDWFPPAFGSSPPGRYSAR